MGTLSSISTCVCCSTSIQCKTTFALKMIYYTTIFSANGFLTSNQEFTPICFMIVNEQILNDQVIFFKIHYSVIHLSENAKEVRMNEIDSEKNVGQM